MSKDTDKERTPDQARAGQAVLWSRTGLALGSFVVLSVALYVGHRLYSGKPVSLPTPKYFPSKRDRPQRQGPLPTAATDRYQPRARVATTVKPIERPAGKEPLLRFFEALSRTERKQPGAITRVCHFGDSQVVADNITSTVRRRLQKRFGDAGHGFLNVGRHKGYRHADVDHWSQGWRFAGIVRGGFKDHRYGLAGVHSYARVYGPFARFGTKKDGVVGRRVSRFEISYLVHPLGGKFEVRLNDKVYGVVNTRTPAPPKAVGPDAGVPSVGPDAGAPPAPPTHEAVYRVTTADGPHQLHLRALGNGVVRFFGVTLERDQPGVVYDSLGQLGTQMWDYLRIDAAHFATQLQWRRPDLVVFGFGTNEADQRVPMRDYRPKWKALLGRVHRALPAVSCLVLGPVDKVYQHTSHPRILELTQAMRATALENGCAFWNTLEAMGGKGAAYRWRRAKLYWGDLAHLNKEGGEKLGNLIATALIEAYQRWKVNRKGPREAPRKVPAAR